MRKCSVPKCDQRIQDDKLMCSVHWFYVPGFLRNKIWDKYHLIRRMDKSDPLFSKAQGEYFESVKDAIKRVRAKEVANEQRLLSSTGRSL